MALSGWPLGTLFRESFGMNTFYMLTDGGFSNFPKIPYVGIFRGGQPFFYVAKQLRVHPSRKWSHCVWSNSTGFPLGIFCSLKFVDLVDTENNVPLQTKIEPADRLQSFFYQLKYEAENKTSN